MAITLGVILVYNFVTGYGIGNLAEIDVSALANQWDPNKFALVREHGDKEYYIIVDYDLKLRILRSAYEEIKEVLGLSDMSGNKVAHKELWMHLGGDKENIIEDHITKTLELYGHTPDTSYVYAEYIMHSLRAMQLTVSKLNVIKERSIGSMGHSVKRCTRKESLEGIEDE